MATPPIQTEGPFSRASTPFRAFLTRWLCRTAVALPFFFMLGAVLRSKGIL